MDNVTPYSTVSRNFLASGVSRRAAALRLGLGRVALDDRINGRTRWTIPDAIALADLLEVTLDELVGRDDLALGYELAGESA